MHSASVVARLDRQPGIPETSAFEPISRGVLDCPLSRVMTVEGVSHVSRDMQSPSDGAIAPE
jgi:hypothetical protein